MIEHTGLWVAQACVVRIANYLLCNGFHFPNVCFQIAAAHAETDHNARLEHHLLITFGYLVHLAPMVGFSAKKRSKTVNCISF